TQAKVNIPNAGRPEATTKEFTTRLVEVPTNVTTPPRTDAYDRGSSKRDAGILRWRATTPSSVPTTAVLLRNADAAAVTPVRRNIAPVRLLPPNSGSERRSSKDARSSTI